jgi:hypothetical protein
MKECSIFSLLPAAAALRARIEIHERVRRKLSEREVLGWDT